MSKKEEKKTPLRSKSINQICTEVGYDGDDEQIKFNIAHFAREVGSINIVKENLKYWKRVKADENKDERKHINHEKYADTETFLLYLKNDKGEYDEEDPLVVPYLIGLCDPLDEKDPYKTWEGLDSGERFIKYIYNRDNWLNKGTDKNEWIKWSLWFFNTEYDFNVIRPIIDKLKQVNKWGYNYLTTDTNDFLFGDLTFNSWNKDDQENYKSTKIRLSDLYIFDKTKSVARWCKDILDVIFDPKTNDIRKISSGAYLQTSKLLYDELTKWGFNKSTFKKLELGDKLKINLHKKDDGNYYYYTSLEDLKNDQNLRKLDLEAEHAYLRNDVLSLPVIRLAQQRIIEDSLTILKDHYLLTKGEPLQIKKHCHALGVPGVGKYLFQEYLNEYLTEGYRYPVSLLEYEKMNSCYFGGFTAGNKDLTYVDEQVFKDLYPNLSFYFYDQQTNKEQPRIASYDINSSYPWSMNTGLPYGKPIWKRPRDYKSKLDPTDPLSPSKYVTFVRVRCNDFIDELNTPYKWKDKYNWTKGTFFGSTFDRSIIPQCSYMDKCYVLKEMWELFTQMCDHKMELVEGGEVYYLRKKGDAYDFINCLYGYKSNKSNPDPLITTAKLIMNSLYGKMAERYKDENIKFVSRIGQFILNNPEYLELRQKHNISSLEDINRVKHEAWFRNNISPTLEDALNCGYVYCENYVNRYDEDFAETREGIACGIYITSMSRHKLLKAVKDEIDNGNIPLYCDTDSIKLIQINKPVIDINAVDLGAWKNEGYFTHFGHNHKRKKYFMHNADIPVIKGDKKNFKQRWMVKTSGVPGNVLLTEEGEYDLESIKKLFDPKVNIVIEQAKPISKRNSKHQILINKADYTWCKCTESEEGYVLIKGKLYSRHEK